MTFLPFGLTFDRRPEADLDSILKSDEVGRGYLDDVKHREKALGRPEIT